MDVKATLEERISKKTGKPYTVLVIHLTDSCKKQVFLEDAELELVQMRMKENSITKRV